MQRKRMDMAALVVAILGVTSVAQAATYYLDAINGSDSSGNGSSGSPWASMSKVFTVVGPGDTVYLRPGNYGSVTFENGSGLGSSSGRVTYMADPATTTPRPADWFEEPIADRPDPGNPNGKVIFGGVTFDEYSLDNANPAGHYVTIEGLNIVGSRVNFRRFVSEVTVRDCNVFGNWGTWGWDVTGTAFNLYWSTAWAQPSNYRDILIEDCYAEDCQNGVYFLGTHTNITVRGCHFYHLMGTYVSFNANTTNVVVDGCHMHEQDPLPNSAKGTRTIVAVGSPANTTFTASGDTDGGIWPDCVAVTDSDTGTEAVRDVASFDHGTHVVVLAQPLPFNAEVGDSMTFWDKAHGSGISVRNGDFTVRNCRVHDVGGTRGIYFYTPPAGGYQNVIIENNLIYSIINQGTVDFNNGLGNNCSIINNTFVGRKHQNYDTGDASMYYGMALNGCGAASGATASTITVANNLLVGKGTAPSGAVVKNNIVFDGSAFEEDSSGNNADNLVYYAGEPKGSEPHPFDGSGNYFVGGGLFDTLAMKTQHSENFNAAYRIVGTASAVGYADPATATSTDMTGAARDGDPDTGCYEYDGVVPNYPPTADAGPDQEVMDSDDNGSEDITLDGSGSSDSDGTIVSYVWEENSSQIATGVSPVVTLSVAVHTIDLTVTDDDSDTDTDSVQITINPYGNIPPTADAGPDQFVTDTDEGGDEDVTLDGSGSSDSDGTIVSYVWEENSSQIATGVSPIVTLTVAVHTIDLTVTDDGSATDTDSVVITVNPGGVPIDIVFDNVSSAAGTATSSLSWSHTIGGGANRALIVGVENEDDNAGEMVISSVTYNGVAMDLVAGSQGSVGTVAINHTALYYLLDASLPAAGTYTVAVTYAGANERHCAGAISLAEVAQQPAEAVVTNSNGSASDITTNITTLTDGAWVVDAAQSGHPNTMVATASGMVQRYSTSGSGGQTGAGATKPVATAGSTAMSWDYDDAETARLVHSVAAFAPATGGPPVNDPPTANAGPDQNVDDSDDNGSEDVTLDGSGSSDSDGTIVSYEWEEASVPIATGVSPLVTLSVAVHTIDLIVTDDDSATDTDSVQVTVNAYVNVPPTADAGPDQNVTDTDQGGDEDVTLDGSGSSDSDGTIVSYVWEENSSQIATGVSPIVTLDVNVHTIDLTVTDDDSATDSDSVVITVNAGGVPQDIVYDNVSSSTINPGTTLSWSHTIGGGANRLLVVGTGAEDNVIGNMTVTSVTYNGVAMTPVSGGSSTVDTGYIMKVDLYYMLEASLPAAGSYTVVVTYAAEVDQIGAGAISLANVAQQGAEAVNTATSTATSISTSLTTLTDGAWIVDIVGCGNPGSFTATGGQTERFDVATASSTNAASTLAVATAGSATVSWDYDGSVNRASQAAAAFAPASGPPPVNDPPTADAGPDQNVTDNDDNGSEDVTLDGSGSSDSDGTIVSYEWEESSVPIASGVSPLVALSVAVHTIDLIVTDDDSDTDTDSVVITVNPYVNVPPTADAGPDQNVTDSNDSGNEDVTLDGSGSSDSDGTIVSYEWEEASVPIASGVSPLVTLSVAVHTIDLTVTDDDSATDSDSVQITVNPYVNVPPTADAGPDQLVTDTDRGGDEDVTLDGSGSSDSDGTIVSYEWEEASVPIASGVSPLVTLTLGTHTIDLTVTDDDSDTDSDSVAIEVNDPPVADAGTDQNVTDNDDNGTEDITLDGSGSSDSDGTIAAYDWEESSAPIASGVSPLVTLDVAVHTIDLIVTDDDSATGTDSVVITVNAYVNVPPTADAGPDQNVDDLDDSGDEDVTLDGSGSSDSDGTITAYDWEEASVPIATGVSPLVTLSVAVHTIDLIVTDDDSDTDTDSVQITVNAYVNVPPTADAGPDQNVDDLDDSGDEDVTLDGSGSSDSDGTITAYDWEEASVPIASGVSPLVTLSVAVHTIDLIVTDDDSDTDSDSVQITVNAYVNVPPTADAGPDQNVDDADDSGDEDVTLDGSGSSDSDGTIVSYEWEEASVPIAMGVSPLVTLSVAVHTIDLIVTDDDSDTDSDSVQITVNAYVNVPPTADAGPDQNVTDTDQGGDEDVTLDGSGSSDSDGTIVSYEWEEASVPIATGVSPIVTLSVAVHGIDLTVTDDDSATDSDSVVITVNAGGAPANIEFDAVSTGTINGTATVSWSHTIGSGSNRLLVVGLGSEDNKIADLEVTSVTYDGVAMTLVAGSSVASGSSWRAKTDLYYMLEADLPAAGTYTVTVTYGGDVARIAAGAISLANVAQQAAEEVNTTANTDPASIATDVTTLTDGAWLVDSVASGNPDSFTATGTGQVERYDIYTGGSTAAGSTKPVATAGVATMSWNYDQGNSNRMAQSVAAFAPATGGPPVNDPPTADAGPDQNVTDDDDNGSEDVTLDGSGSSDSDGTIVSYDWEESSVPIASGVSPLVTLSVAVHTIDLIVTDDDSDTDTDSVVITVDPHVNVPPTADAGPDQDVTDDDDNGSEDVTLDGSGSSDSDGTIVSYEWEEASVPIASGVSPVVTLSVAVHTIDLTVTDDDSATDSDSVVVTVSEDPLTQGLVGFWPFEGSGSTVTDASGSGHDGTLSGATRTAAGQTGNALSFDEVDDYVQIPDWDYTNASDEFSVNLWFKIDDVDGTLYQYLFSHGLYNAVNSLNVYFREAQEPENPEVVRTVVVLNDSTSWSVDTPTTLADGLWHMYTITVSATAGATIYVDGSPAVFDANFKGAAFNPTTDIHFGSRCDLNANRFFGNASVDDGLLDEIRIYSRALTGPEVNSLYTGN